MKQPLRHPRLGADDTEAEKLGYHSSVLCADGSQRFGICCPWELANIYWSTGCSPFCTHWVAVAVCTPPPQGLSPVFSCIIDSFQSMKLVHLPQTLTLHLKRFCFERSSRTHKLSHSLPFPQELDLRQVLAESQCQADDNEKVRYSCS